MDKYTQVGSPVLNGLTSKQEPTTRTRRDRLMQMITNQEVKDTFSFKYYDFALKNHNPHTHIATKMAVYIGHSPPTL